MGAEERFNAITHSVGALLAAIGGCVLVIPALARGEYLKATGFAIYALSLVLVYLSSTLFHIRQGQARERLRSADRISIYLMIAGTYTPVALLRLPPAWGWPLLVTAWALATLGTAIELFMVNRRRTPVSVTLYLIMGWMVVLAFKPLATTMTVDGLALMVAGGVIYSVGAVILRLNLMPHPHAIWHILVLVASACHFAMMALYVT